LDKGSLFVDLRFQKGEGVFQDGGDVQGPFFGPLLPDESQKLLDDFGNPLGLPGDDV
jgi:hypothetical protein